MNNIENLLRHQQEGALTPEEQDELNRLTHRDRVLQAAAQQAHTLRRRQYLRASAVTSVILIAGACFLTFPSANPEASGTPIVAQSDAPSPKTVLAAQEALSNDAPALPQATPSDKRSIGQKELSLNAAAPAAIEQQQPAAAANLPVENIVDELEPSAIVQDNPIVACNTQCSPDSVINDIWKFLRT